MEQFDNKENYLELIKSQIRNKKAKSLVSEEIDHHIEDQKASYMKEGYMESIAMIKALEQMGDPIDIGIRMDKIHKPRMEWKILIIALALCCVGTLVQLSIINATDTLTIMNTAVGRHILHISVGFLIMIIVYFVDYSMIGKYPKAIWILLMVGFFLLDPFGNRVNGRIPYMYAFGMLLIPTYGGVIYAFRNKGYVGLIKCLFLSLSASMIELLFVTPSAIFLGLILSNHIMLSIAVMKKWFSTSRLKAMAIIWGWIPIILYILVSPITGVLKPYQLIRLKDMTETIQKPELHPGGYEMSIVRQVISNAELFRGSREFMNGKLPNLSNDYILTYVIGKWGKAAGFLIIVLFVIFIGYMIRKAFKQKNFLGMFVGLGCSLALAVQGSGYIVANFGIRLMAQINLPFVSYGGSSLCVNFIILGIMLSVFRNTNIMKEVPYKKFSIDIKRLSKIL